MILLTGFTGKLGKYLIKYPDVIGIKFDITKDIPDVDVDMVIHCAAYTDVMKAETDDEKCFHTNVYGTHNLVNHFKDVPFVLISSEYAKNPLGVYALSKKLSEEIVKSHPHYLIIRTLFKPNPYPFDVAYADQFTQGDYVDIIAEKIWQHIRTWNRKNCELAYVGTGRKTMFELALRTKPNVKPNTITNPIIPSDYL